MTSSFRPSAPPSRAEFVPAVVPSPADGTTPVSATGTEIEDRIRIAFEEGIAAGRAELPWQQAEALESATLAIQGATARLEASAQAPVFEMQRAIVELACALAEHLVEAQLSADLDALTPLLTESLAMLSGLEPLVISLSPEDHATLAAGDARGLQALAERSGAAIEADASVAARSARIRGGDSVAKIELREVIERLRGFLAELANGPPPPAGEAT